MKQSNKCFLQHYGREFPAEPVLGDEFLMPAFINPDVLSGKFFTYHEVMTE